MSWETVQGAIPPKKWTRSGCEYQACCPAHEDHNPSLSVTFANGRTLLHCFAGCSNESIVAAAGLSMADLMAEDPVKRPKKAKQQQPKDDPGVLLVPVPEDAPAPPRWSGGSWDYRDADGNLHFVVNRKNNPGGGKDIRPYTYRDKNGQRSWKQAAVPYGRIQYRSDKLAANPGAVLVVLEGEKATDAAVRLGVEGFEFTTSSGGSNAAAKTDWALCHGRQVLVLPDCDAPGRHYAAEVKRLGLATGATSVTVLDTARIFGKDPGSGWDIADATDEERQQFRDILASRQFGLHEMDLDAGQDGEEAKAEKEQRGRKKTVADRLVDIGSRSELFHNKNGDVFATVKEGGHRETYPVNSSAFQIHLNRSYYSENNTCPNAQAMQDALRVLMGKARFEGEELEVHFRLGGDQTEVYLDLCNPEWEYVRITRDGWEVRPQDAKVRFVRRKGQQRLPTPQRGGSLELLRQFINSSWQGFVLMVAWLVAAMQPGGPYLIMAVGGEHGSGKSTFTKLLKMIVDPVLAVLRSIPGDERDLAIAAKNSFILAFDNLSGISTKISDALCRLVFGVGFATRELYSNDDEAVFEGARPTIVNGIEDLLIRADLADRAVTVHCQAIPPTERRTEKEFWGEFSKLHGLILGALCDAVVTGQRRLDVVEMPEMPRMADAAKWIVACEPALPWPEGEFIKIYNQNVATVQDVALEADTFATALLDCLDRGLLSGPVTATEIRSEVEKAVQEDVRRLDHWPKNPRAVVGRLKRILPLLRAKGWAYADAGKGSRSRLTRYEFAKTKVGGPYPSQPLDPSHIHGYDSISDSCIARGGEAKCEGYQNEQQYPSQDPSHVTHSISDSRGVARDARGTHPLLSQLSCPVGTEPPLTPEEQAYWEANARMQ